MSNIAEGFERGTLPELNRFLGIAKGSCGEVRSQLYEARDDDLISIDDFNRIKSLALSTSELIGALKAATQKRIRSKLQSTTSNVQR